MPTPNIKQDFLPIGGKLPTQGPDEIGGGTTTVLMKAFSRKQYDISDQVPDGNPHVASIAIRERIAAQAALRILFDDNVTEITQILNGIQANLDALGSVRSTTGLRDSFNTQFMPLKSQVTEELQKRNDLTQTVGKEIQEQHKILKSVAEETLKEAQEKKKSHEIPTKIAAIDKIYQDLDVVIARLEYNEQVLIPQLNQLHSQIDVARRSQQIPITFTPPELQ